MNTPTVSNRANFEAVRSGHRTFQEASPGENMANGTSLHPSTGSSGSTLGTERTTGGNQSPDRLLTPDDVATCLGTPFLGLRAHAPEVRDAAPWHSPGQIGASGVPTCWHGSTGSDRESREDGPNVDADYPTVDISQFEILRLDNGDNRDYTPNRRGKGQSNQRGRGDHPYGTTAFPDRMFNQEGAKLGVSLPGVPDRRRWDRAIGS